MTPSLWGLGITILLLPSTAISQGAPPAYVIDERDFSGDFHAPVSAGGGVYFHTDKNYTSAGGESVVRGIYEFDLILNEFVDLNVAEFAYDTSGGFVAPRRVEYDAVEEQVYVMEYSGSSPDEMRVLQIDWPSRMAVIENDLIAFGANPPVSGFLNASRGAAVDAVARRIRIGNNEGTNPNSLLFVMVPEPGSTTLLLFGLPALALLQRFRVRERV